MTVKMILFPSSYHDINKVDEDLQKEYKAVLQTGLFDVSFFSYDKWFNENRLAVTHTPGKETSAVYRGWMMQPEQYTRFYNLLLEKNIRLITDPKQYELMHIFPNVYKYIEEDTASEYFARMRPAIRY